MESRAAGYCGSELMQMGGAGSSRGITSKAFGAEEQTLRGPASAGGRRGSRPERELRGMLTIMTASTNPGVSHPALPHKETGYCRPPTASDILPH